MSFEVYVGNIPLDFKIKDVVDIFGDFDGIKVEKIFKRGKKCYSFFACKDIDQVVSVIRQKNNAIVSGRKLIVRASHKKLQEYVELMLRGDEDETEAARESCRQKYVDSPHFIPLQVLRNEASKRGNVCLDEKCDEYLCCSPSLSIGDHFQEQFCEDSGFETSSSKSNYPVHHESVSVLHWVSVTNFPLGTSIRDLYDLFIDYDPVDIQMICNEPRRDKTITEAHVGFVDIDTVYDVILNFDNTLFRRRVLLVNDMQDFNVMNELLNGLQL